MDILFSAIVGDLCSRSASFLITKYFQQQPGIDMILQRLERVVLRIDTVVEEAERRHITNQGMLRQLMTLRHGMYRGHYILDALRFQANGDEEEEEEDGGLSHSSSALSKFSPAKRICFSRTGSCSSKREVLLFGTKNNIQEELRRVVDTLEDTMTGMKEFLFFLESYARIHRQPYGACLLLDNCMFGRQMERQWILNFLTPPTLRRISALRQLHVWSPDGTATDPEFPAAFKCYSRFGCTSNCRSNKSREDHSC